MVFRSRSEPARELMPDAGVMLKGLRATGILNYAGMERIARKFAGATQGMSLSGKEVHDRYIEAVSDVCGASEASKGLYEYAIRSFRNVVMAIIPKAGDFEGNRARVVDDAIIADYEFLRKDTIVAVYRDEEGEWKRAGNSDTYFFN